ncbi:MAG: hypothetical protein GY756_27310 [bacterium]|nr:hypothetical protein [bacterium]
MKKLVIIFSLIAITTLSFTGCAEFWRRVLGGMTVVETIGDGLYEYRFCNESSSIVDVYDDPTSAYYDDWYGYTFELGLDECVDVLADYSTIDFTWEPYYDVYTDTSVTGYIYFGDDAYRSAESMDDGDNIGKAKAKPAE